MKRCPDCGGNELTIVGRFIPEGYAHYVECDFCQAKGEEAKGESRHDTGPVA